MSKLPISQEDLDQVKNVANQLAVDVLKGYEAHPLSPLLALATLTLAACQVALVTDTTYAQLMELITVHYQSAAVGLAVQELEAQLGQKLPAKIVVDGAKS